MTKADIKLAIAKDTNQVAELETPTVVIRIRPGSNPPANYGHKYHLINRANWLTSCGIVIRGGKFGMKWEPALFQEIRASDVCAECFRGFEITDNAPAQMELVF